MNIKSRKIIALCFLWSMVLTGCGQSQTAQNDVNESTKELYAMDTIMDLTIHGENAGNVMNDAVALIHQYESSFSVNIADSDISQLNAASGQAVTVSDETYDLLQKSIAISKKTEGLLDVSIYPLVKAWGFTTEKYRIPNTSERNDILNHVDYRKIKLLADNQVKIEKEMQLDLGSVAKGYLSQKLMELFQKENMTSAIISLGGNVQTMGTKSDGSEYTVGITDPSDGSSVYGTLQLKDEAVVTSGIYQRYFEKDGVCYHHIMDKRTGMPADNTLASVTIVTKDGTTADGLATALYVMGAEKAMEYQKKHAEDIQIILIYKDGTSWNSDGINFVKK